jgi:hypothetical protein
MTLQERNVALLDAIPGIFDFKAKSSLEDLKASVTAKNVRTLYDYIAWLWPPSTNVPNLLPRPDTKLRALYLGDARPEAIVRNVFRFGLYADEILAISPFHNPWIMAESFNPLVNPDQWRSDTLKLLLFVGTLDPWVRAGLVTLVPNPNLYDPELFRRTAALAKDRLRGYKPTPQDIRDVSVEEETKRMFMTAPLSFFERTARELNPDLSEAGVQELLIGVEASRKRDPLLLDETLEESGAQMMVFRSGANLETAIYLAQLTGAFPYTTLGFRWKELMSVRQDLPEAAQVWTPLTRAFQTLQFRFLDRVDPRFALRMRADGRLQSFRSFLRRLWRQSEGNTAISETNLDRIAREYSDELTDEYRKAEAEWDGIDRDLLKWFGPTMAGTIATGSLGLSLPAAGFSIAAVTELIVARRKRGEFRKRIPMSVFVDLSKS